MTGPYVLATDRARKGQSSDQLNAKTGEILPIVQINGNSAPSSNPAAGIVIRKTEPIFVENVAILSLKQIKGGCTSIEEGLLDQLKKLLPKSHPQTGSQTATTCRTKLMLRLVRLYFSADRD